MTEAEDGRGGAGSHEELGALWRWFAAEECAGYSPLYEAIVVAAAEDHELLSLVAIAPEASRYPLMTLAAVHDMVLAGELPELAEVYRGDGPIDTAPALFRAAVLDHREHVVRILHERFVQTNECGRAPALALGLSIAAADVGEPAALVDAGASAGLNLLYDWYRLELGDVGVWGDPSSPVVCPCSVRGESPEALRFVDVPVRVGLDRAPVDVTDPIAARWLLACTWPDTGRLDRTRAAIDIAASSPPEVRTGDLVDDLPPLLASLAGDGPVVVVTSWALGYLSGPQRKGFVEALADEGLTRPVVWLSLEAPGAVRGIDAASPPRTAIGPGPSLVGLTRFGPTGIESQRALAHVHPHGSMLEWIPQRSPSVGPSEAEGDYVRLRKIR